MNGDQRMSASDKTSAPRLLRIATGAFGLLTFVLPILLIFVLIASADYEILLNGERVAIGEVRTRLALHLLAYIPIAAILGYGLRRRKDWARHALFAVSGLPYVYVLLATGIGLHQIFVVSFLAILTWYLYKKPNVKSYFGDVVED